MWAKPACPVRERDLNWPNPLAAPVFHSLAGTVAIVRPQNSPYPPRCFAGWRTRHLASRLMKLPSNLSLIHGYVPHWLAAILSKQSILIHRRAGNVVANP